MILIGFLFGLMMLLVIVVGLAFLLAIPKDAKRRPVAEWKDLRDELDEEAGPDSEV